MSNVLSLILVRISVRNKPPAEITRSASTDVGGTVWSALWSSCNCVVCFFPAMKSPISLANVSWTSVLFPELYGEELPNQASLLNTHDEIMFVVVMLSLLDKQVMYCLKSETYLRHLVMRRPNPFSVFLKALVWFG